VRVTAAPATAELAYLDSDTFAGVIETLVPEDTRALAVAVSGGADSVALALLLRDWCGARIALTALTVDHGLRDESAHEAQQVAAWMAAQNIPHRILTWEEGHARRGLPSSPHADARAARYRLLIDWCRAAKVPAVCTAHHADDQVETFLMRLARGSGLEGLSAIRAREDTEGIVLLRPLLGFPKAVLLDTCRARGQAWVEDSSNLNPAFTRARFRRAREFLAAEGLSDERLLATVGHLQRAQDAIDFAVANLEQRVQRDQSGACVIAADELMTAPSEVGLRLLSRLLSTVAGQAYGPRFDSLSNLYARLGGATHLRVTLHGCVISRIGESVRIAAETRTRSAFL
jgi:tRNA(Ile)-lysidine synthase